MNDMKDELQLDFPIQYAILPIKEQGDCCVTSFGIVAYIVSKCYCVGEKIQNFSDGSVEHQYEVVFPYRDGDLEEKQIPTYGNDKYTNSTFVSQVFDVFEEAKAYADVLNRELLNHDIGVLPYNDEFQQKVDALRERHEFLLEHYQNLEQRIENCTIYMKKVLKK